MTYLIDGQPLDDPTLNWVLRAVSKPLPTLEFSRHDLVTAGRDGVLPGMPVTVEAPTIALTVQTPRENLPTLIALAARGSYLTDSARPSQRVHYELVQAEPTGYGPENAVVEARLVLRYPQVTWRDTTLTTTPATTLTAASITVPGLFPGTSAEIPDALIRIKGAATGVQVTDAGSGSWFTYAAPLSASEYLRFDSATGRAWITTTDTWTGGTDVSGDLDYGGERGWFELSPTWGATPATRSVAITIATASRTGAAIQVRGRGAYVV